MGVEHDTAASAVVEFLSDLWRRLSFRAALAACVLVLAAAMLAAHFSGSGPVKMEASRLSRHTASKVVSVNMAYRVPACYFHQEGNQVIDTVTCQTVVANGFLLAGTQSLDPHKP